MIRRGLLPKERGGGCWSAWPICQLGWAKICGGYGIIRHPVAAPFSMKTIAEPRTKTLTVNEIYHSIQGESTWAGQPCVFVRLTFCDLRCNYCDTAYAFHEGEKKTVPDIVAEVLK